MVGEGVQSSVWGDGMFWRWCWLHNNVNGLKVAERMLKNGYYCFNNNPSP